jgi:hypothetical protein
VFGIFQTRTELESAVERLRTDGFRADDVSTLMPTNESRRSDVGDMGTEKETKAPEGATTGGVTGAVVGGALGWLAGIGALAIPGLGPFIAAGPIMALLAGASVGAGVGGVAGALIGMGIPEYEAKRYETQLREGRFLLSVHCDDDDWVTRAKNVLRDCGAIDISSTGESSVPGDKTDKLRRDEVRPEFTPPYSATPADRNRGVVPPPHL